MENTNTKNHTKDKANSKKRLWIVILFVIAILIYMFVSIRGGYLNILELGENYIEVFKQNLLYKCAITIVNFMIIFALIYITNKFIRKGLKAFFEDDKLDMPKLPNKSIALILAGIISIATSSIFTEKTMLALNTAWFGTNDPIFNIDIGYFFFQKPFIELIMYYALGLIVFLTIYTIIYYIVAFNVYFDGIDIQTLKKSILPKQLIVYIMTIAIIIAGLSYIGTQNIVYEKFLNTGSSAKTVIYGAGATDVTIKLWGYRIFAIVIILAVAMTLRNIYVGKKKKAVMTFCIIPGYLVGLFIIMTGFQVLFVSSNELDKEKRYISYNIESTKNAYSINIDEIELSNSGTLTAEQIKNNDEMINNIPIISKDVISKSLDEYQTSTGYYTYRNINLAEYNINGENKAIYVSPREIISDNKRTYDNKTYEYTHGYGVVLSSATITDENGNVEHIQKEFDGSDAEIEISRPQIYFGTQTNSNIIVNAKGKVEYDYPITSSTNAEYIYEGETGLNLSFFDRLILAINHGDFNLVFNTNIKNDTKIITNRNIIERAKNVLPYLIYDNNPYMVIREDGSLVWVLDAYTVSNNYPYSQESIIAKDDTKISINYIRNSVKVIIDAYNGTMQFYITDRSDPIAMAYRNIYSTLFMPLDKEIDEDILKHIVYPKYLYEIQAKVLERYHNIQTDVLYRNDDVWNIARVSGGKNNNSASSNLSVEMDEYYSMIKTVDSDTAELGLVIPYTLEDKQNINAYLVGKFDRQNKLTLYKFKSDDNMLGAVQLEKQIENDELISEQLKSINVTGAKIQKNMIIVPVDNTLLYVQPVYQILLNESQVPVLKKVIVASGNRVAIGDNIEMAINNLLSQEAVEIDVENTESQEGLIQAIIKANNNLDESKNNNDWELMGKDIGKLQELIKQLEAQIKKNEEKITNELVNNELDNNTIIENNIIYNEI